MSSCAWAHRGSLVGRKCLGGCCRALTGCMTAVGCKMIVVDCMTAGVGCRTLAVPGTVRVYHSVGSAGRGNRMLGMVLVNVDHMAVAVAAGRTLHRLHTLEIDPVQASPGDIHLAGHMADHTVPGCCCKTGHRSQTSCFVDIHNLAKLGTCPGQEIVLLQVLLLLPRLPWIRLSHYHCDLACPTPCLPSFAALAVPLPLRAHPDLPSTSA